MHNARTWLPWVLGLAAVVGGPALAAPAAPPATSTAAAARGLATFIHGPSTVAPGAELPLVLVVYGFSKVTEGAPLPGATVELAWDPEHVDPAEVAARSVPVVATSDAQGAALVKLVAPHGVGPWKLLVRTKSGDKERTDELAVTRTQAETVRVSPSTTKARAGSSLHVWTEVTSGAAQVANEEVRFDVLEGDVVIATVSKQTDASGRADTELQLPRGSALLSGWSIQVTTAKQSTATAFVSLRDDTPDAARIGFDAPDAPPSPGGALKLTGLLLDPTGSPVQNTEVSWWAGPSNVAVSVDDEAKWKKLATRARTDQTGHFQTTSTMPSVIGRAGLTWLTRAVALVNGERVTIDHSETVGKSQVRLRLWSTHDGLTPGLAQNLLLTADDAHGDSVKNTSFRVEADGLKTTVNTNEHGEAVIPWTVPRGVGTTRQVEPCSGGVAANVAVVAEASAVAAGFPPRSDLCVPVNRESSYRVRVDPPAVRAGESVQIHVDSIDAKSAAKTFSLVARPDDESVTTRTALARGGAASISTAGLEPGSYTVSAIGITPSDPKRDVEPAVGRFLVVPVRWPKPVATLRSTTHVAGGHASVELRVVDDQGKPFTGTVGAIVTDQRYDSQSYAASLDVRRSFCADGERDALRCADGSAQLASRMQITPSYLAESFPHPVTARQEPLRNAKADAERTFSEVVRSLEGAVFEASGSRETLQDVRRVEGGRSRFNPELLTLAVQALGDPPHTPGGEPVSLADLVSLDAQVDYDHVARRVTRYKMFQVLETLRAQKQDRDSDDFAFDEPNAWLRRLLRQGTIEESSLIDPWGGTMAFVKVGAGTTPTFLTPRRGYELHAPGPDGKLGTGDDVKSPFERVLRSGSPYAVATDEDAVVDAPFDLQVAQTSVDAWKQTLETATGRSLGLAGASEGGGGTGQGYGSGHGSLRGGHTSSVGHGAGIGSGYRTIVAPHPIGADGVVRFDVPLGDEETTYRVLLVADVPGLGRLAERLDVPVILHQSLQVRTGDRWTVGDRGDVSVVIENRDAAPAQLELVTETASNVTLQGRARRTVDVPAHGQRIVPLTVSTPRAGEAKLRLALRRGGTVVDHYEHVWEVAPSGEPITLAEAAWIKKDSALARPRREGHVPNGPQILELQTNGNDLVQRALLSVQPTRIMDRRQAEDARLLALAAKQLATAQNDLTLARFAQAMVDRAGGRASALPAVVREDVARSGNCVAIPADRLFRDDPEGAKAKPPAPGTAFAPFAATAQCFDTQINARVEDLLTHGETADLARAALELAEHEPREPLAAAVTRELAKRVRVQPDGRLAAPERQSREERVLVLAALLRNAGATRVAPSALLPWLVVEQDAYGSFGSVAATSAAVRALVASGALHEGAASVEVALPSGARTIQLPAHGVVKLPLADGEKPIAISVHGAPILARITAPTLRSFLHPPLAPAGAPEVQVDWPEGARAEQDVKLSVHVAPGAGASELRLPLPPNVQLQTKPAGGARLVDHVLRIPIPKAGFAAQFSLRTLHPGRFTVPEGGLYDAGERRVVVPARAFSVR